MSKFEIQYATGATLLSDVARKGLISDYITTHAELNELEQKNIQSAHIWLQKNKSKEILEMKFIYELHKKMFGDVWRWAGTQRTSDTNLGADKHQIAIMLGTLLGDTKFWLEQKTYPIDEIAMRFHHRLVHIHPFENGNGRHSRLIADILLEQHGETAFSWGTKKYDGPLETKSNRRDKYIAALKLADNHQYDELLDFVRS